MKGSLTQSLKERTSEDGSVFGTKEECELGSDALVGIVLGSPRENVDVGLVIILRVESVKVSRKEREENGEEHPEPEVGRGPQEGVVAVDVGPQETGLEGRIDGSVAEDEDGSEKDTSKDPPIPRTSVETGVHVGSQDGGDGHDSLKKGSDKKASVGGHLIGA